MIKLTHLLNEVRVYGKFDKKKLLKLIKKQDDAMIQNSDGKEFVIYSPFTNNKDPVSSSNDTCLDPGNNDLSSSNETTVSEIFDRSEEL